MIDQIDLAICLTLDKRIEYAKTIVTSAKNYGIDVDLFLAGDGSIDLLYDHVDINSLPPRYEQSLNYPSWTGRTNAYNAWLCHRKMIHKALSSGAKNLMILEDDIIFEEDFSEILEKVTPFFNSNKWDMIYFGWYSNDHLQPTDNEHVYRMMGGGGFHGVLINRNVLELLFEYHPLGPYDFISGVFLHDKIKAYAIYPCIISQMSGYSYVEGGTLEKPDRHKK